MSTFRQCQNHYDNSQPDYYYEVFGVMECEECGNIQDVEKDCRDRYFLFVCDVCGFEKTVSQDDE